MFKIIKGLFMIGLVAGVAGLATYAFRSQTITVSANTFDPQNATFKMGLNNNNPTPSVVGAALKAENFYPGAFDESSGIINNQGTIAFNPELKLANSNDPAGLADYLWLEIWTNGKLFFSDQIKNFPGYTSGKLVLDKIDPGQNLVVAYRVLMLETAPNGVQGGEYSVDLAITAHQWNDPDYQPSTPIATSVSRYVANTWSYNVCGVRQPDYYQAVYADGSNPTSYDDTTYSPYFSYSVQGGSPWGWAVHSVPSTYQGGSTGGDYGCTVD